MSFPKYNSLGSNVALILPPLCFIYYSYLEIHIEIYFEKFERNTKNLKKRKKLLECDDFIKT